jgi:hypothetical protein
MAGMNGFHQKLERKIRVKKTQTSNNEKIKNTLRHQNKYL